MTHKPPTIAHPVQSHLCTPLLPSWIAARDTSTVGRSGPIIEATPEPKDNDVLTIPEVARRLRVSTRSVSRWIASGELTCIRIGRVVRVPNDAVDALFPARKIS